MIIYKITNKVNDKVYIGRTKSRLQDRWWQHCYEARTCGTDYVFHKAIKEFGEDSFTTEVIFETDNADILSEKEIEFIKLYESLTTQNGYNTRIGGKFAEGMCKKISDRLKGRIISAESKLKMRLAHLGIKHKNPRKPGFKRGPLKPEAQQLIAEKLKTCSSFVTKEQVRGYGGMVYKNPEDKTPEEEARRIEIRLKVLAAAREKARIKRENRTEEEIALEKAAKNIILDNARQILKEKVALGLAKYSGTIRKQRLAKERLEKQIENEENFVAEEPLVASKEEVKKEATIKIPRKRGGSLAGWTHTEETRKKISAILKGSHHKNPRTPGYHIKPRSEERQKQVSDSHKATSNFCAPDAVRSITGMVYKSEADKTPEEEARRIEVRKAVVANMRAKWKIWFDSLTPEQKAERAAKQRAQLDKAREKMVRQLRAGEIRIGPKPKVKTVTEILQENPTPCDTISV